MKLLVINNLASGFGEGSVYDFIRSFARDGDEVCVRSTDGTTDVRDLLGDAEAFGVPGIESMACEVPVVASDTVGASEYILNGVTGYLVKIGNVDRCCECMMELRDKAAREHMGELARGDIKESYELAACREKYEEALRAVGSRVM